MHKPPQKMRKKLPTSKPGSSMPRVKVIPTKNQVSTNAFEAVLHHKSAKKMKPKVSGLSREKDVNNIFDYMVKIE
jgi:hypothetical protein